MATLAITPRPGILRSIPGAQRFAWCVVAYNIFVVLWGAIVRATGSGAGCANSWPLCNGQIIPINPTFHTIIEFIHRQTATVSVLTLILLVAWTWRTTLPGMAARVFVVLSAILLVNEAFLGAVLVKLGYVTGNRSLGRVLVLGVHLSNTLLLVAAMTLTAILLGTRQRWAHLHARGTDKAIAITGLLATLVVGVSGSLAALGDTLFPATSLRAAFAQDIDATSPLLLRLRGIHPLSAFLAAAFVVWLIVRARRAGHRTLTHLVLALLALQFLLGVADVLLLAPTWMQIAHLLGADIYWVALLTLTTRLLWPAPSAEFAIP
jgi:cytochrome c oxidase assembly protein subunit 15